MIVQLWLAGWSASPILAQQICDPLPPPAGNVIDVYPSGVSTLAAIVAGAVSGDTILLHDGIYDLREALQFSTPGVSFRSASGNRDAVIIDGGDQVSVVNEEIHSLIHDELSVRSMALR